MTPEEQANSAALAHAPVPGESRRRLSWVRITGVFVVLAVICGGLVAFGANSQKAKPAPPRSSFTPYVDVTATPQYAFEDPTVAGTSNVVLGFVVSSPGSSAGAACQPSWGGAYSLAAASTGMDLDRRVARLRQRNGDAAISFGGAANSELAIGCTDPKSLASAYKSVIDRYRADTIDLDIESPAASAPAVNARRATAIADVQTAEKAAGHPLAVWLTLPVAMTGLTDEGRAVIASMLAAHVTLAGVNALTMDYGQPLPSGQTMASVAAKVLTTMTTQLSSSYSSAGLSLSPDAAWQHLGATPMIGQNDTASERFELSDANELLAFAKLHHLRRLSMWSLNRDQSCGPNYANVEVVSDACSGVNQTTSEFSKTFASFGSAATGPAPSDTSTPTAASPSVAPTAADNPATSPYQIWNPSQAYPKNTKVTWHHNVYEAKWYTQGDTPDAPVANPADTPWTLIGPVLPGDHPAPTPTVKAGTYPAWSAAAIYTAGDRVVYDGVGYQAKWWTQGDVPGVNTTVPSDTPWQLLTS